MKNRDDYWYEYSIDKANYYMLHNAVCVGTGISPKTNDIFWCFNKQDIKDILVDNKMLDRKHSLTKEEKLIYITNLAQSTTYIKEGVKPLDVFFDDKQNKIVFAFRAIDTKEVWNKWKKHEYNFDSVQGQF